MEINYTELMKQISDTIITSMEQTMKKASYDQSYKAQVTEIVSDKKLKVKINGQERTATTGIKYSVGDYVWVCVPRNNWNSLYVVCKA